MARLVWVHNNIIIVHVAATMYNLTSAVVATILRLLFTDCALGQGQIKLSI